MLFADHPLDVMSSYGYTMAKRGMVESEPTFRVDKRLREWQPDSQQCCEPSSRTESPRPTYNVDATEAGRYHQSRGVSSKKRIHGSDTIRYPKRPCTPNNRAYLDEQQLPQYALVPHQSAGLVSRTLVDFTPSNGLAIVPYVPQYSLLAPPSKCTIEQLDSDDEEETMDVEI
jgi:hypothetical protein